MKSIKRVIMVEDLNEISLENFGGHFTANMAYQHKGGGSNGVTNTNARYKVTFECRQYEVNQDATEISNEEYPREQEVVLTANQSVNGKMSIMERLGNGMYDFISHNVPTTINTGTRFDKWVK